MIVDVLVQRVKAHPADIDVREVIIPCILPQSIQSLDHLCGSELGIIWHIPWIRGNCKRGKFDQQVHCWIHGQSCPSLDEALGAIKLLESLGDMLA
jgi:hypothetical protein